MKKQICFRELLNEERKRVNELLESRFENIATEVNQRNTEAFLQLAEQKFNSDQKEAEKSLDARKMEVENLIKPLREEMTKLSNANSEMEKERVRKLHEAIKRQLKESCLARFSSEFFCSRLELICSWT